MGVCVESPRFGQVSWEHMSQSQQNGRSGKIITNEILGGLGNDPIRIFFHIESLLIEYPTIVTFHGCFM